MTIAFHRETVIPLPPESAWAVLTDWSRAPQWMQGVEDMRAEGPTAEGTALVFRHRGIEHRAAIVACTPPEKIVLRIKAGPGSADYAYTLVPAKFGSTTLRLVAACEFQGLLFKLFSPIVRWTMRRVDGGQLNALSKLMTGR
jgi:uncharacterized protein YndB with AHSA1/START domain